MIELKDFSAALIKGSQLEAKVEKAFIKSSLLAKMGLIHFISGAQFYNFYVPSLSLGSKSYVKAAGADDVKISKSIVEIDQFEKYNHSFSVLDVNMSSGALSQSFLSSVATQVFMAGHSQELFYLEQIKANLVANKAVADNYETISSGDLAKTESKGYDAVADLIDMLTKKNIPGIVGEGSDEANIIAFLSPSLFKNISRYFASTGRRTVELEKNSTEAHIEILGVKCYKLKKLSRNILAGALSKDRVLDLSKFEAIIYDRASINFVLNSLVSVIRENPNNADFNHIVLPQFGAKVNADLKLLQAAVINSAL